MRSMTSTVHLLLGTGITNMLSSARLRHSNSVSALVRDSCRSWYLNTEHSPGGQFIAGFYRNKNMHGTRVSCVISSNYAGLHSTLKTLSYLSKVSGL